MSPSRIPGTFTHGLTTELSEHPIPHVGDECRKTVHIVVDGRDLERFGCRACRSAPRSVTSRPRSGAVGRRHPHWAPPSALKVPLHGEFDFSACAGTARATGRDNLRYSRTSSLSGASTRDRPPMPGGREAPFPRFRPSTSADKCSDVAPRIDLGNGWPPGGPKATTIDQTRLKGTIRALDNRPPDSHAEFSPGCRSCQDPSNWSLGSTKSRSSRIRRPLICGAAGAGRVRFSSAVTSRRCRPGTPRRCSRPPRRG